MWTMVRTVGSSTEGRRAKRALGEEKLLGLQRDRPVYWVSLAGTALTFCAHASADLSQFRFFGGRFAR